MSFLGRSQRLVNRVLERYSLAVVRAERDFDDRLLSEAHERNMLSDLAEQFSGYFDLFPIIPAKTELDLSSWVSEFYFAYRESPARMTGGGSRFCNLLWLFLTARAMDAKLLVDSGTYTGSSAWALRRGAPGAEVHSFDVDRSSRRVEDASIHFHGCDWGDHDFGAIDREASLCYFDDHVDQVRRLLEAKDKGFKYLIFDDDVGVSSTPRMGPSPACLPKLQYVLDDRLRDGEVLEWVHFNRGHRYVVDRAYLDSARAAIQRIGKVPDLSFLTGVQQQLAYTFVALE